MMMRYLYALVFFLIGFCGVAKSSCGSSTCPLHNDRHLKGGFFQIGFRYEYINQDQIHVGSTKSFVGAIPQHHDEVQTVNQRNIVEIAYGLSDKFSLNVHLPFIHREHSHIHHHQGEDLWESWNFSALGDIVVQAQYTFPFGANESGSSIGVVAGMKLPTGATRMKNSEGLEAEVTIQPGTGSLDGVFGLSARFALFSVPTFSDLYGTMPVTMSTTYQINGEGTDDYRLGNVFLAHIGIEYPLARPANVLLQVNGRFQGFADVGITREPRENTSGTWIFLSPGFSIDLSQNLTTNAFLQIPVYQNVHGIQQTAPFNLQFRVLANVELFE